MLPRSLILTVVMALLATGCSKTESLSPDDAQKAVEAAVKVANTAIPADLKDKLKFVSWAEPKKKRYQAVVPDGWVPSKFIPGSFEPDQKAGMGFGTRFSVGSNCDGVCSPKDWAAVAEKVNFKQFKKGSFETIKDQQLPGGGRLLVGKRGDRVFVQMAIWRKDSSRYYTCKAKLGREIAGAASAFEAACRGLQITEW